MTSIPPQGREPDRHRRLGPAELSYTVVGGALVLVLVIAVVLVLSARGTGPSVSSAVPTRSASPSAIRITPLATATPAAPTPSASPTPTATAPRPTVVVLNQSRRSGLAAVVRSRLVGRGWRVTRIANYRGTVAATTVYYGPDLQAAARVLVGDLPGALVRPGLAGMDPRRLTVVVTSSYAG